MMLDPYERLQKIDQTLNEFFEFDGNKILKGIRDYVPYAKLIPKRFMPKQATDPSQKLQLTGDQGSAKMFVPDADTKARIKARQRQTELRLAAQEGPGSNSVAAQNARFQRNMRRGSKVAQGVAAVAGAAAVAPAAAKLALPLVAGAARFGARQIPTIAAMAAYDRIFGGGGEAGGSDIADIASGKLRPKSVGDLDATSAGRDFKAEYGGTSLKKLRGM